MKPAPLCRYCGKPIAKRTRSVYLALSGSGRIESDSGFTKTQIVDRLPTNKAECQRLTNDHVVSVSRTIERDAINRFGTWDGESYVDDFFCNNDHSRRFAYVMARAGYQTEASKQARAAERTRDSPPPSC